MTDRLAPVIRHRRAPAGQPSAGVRADGSSGLWIRLHGREGARKGGPGGPFLCVPPGSPQVTGETEKPCLPQRSCDGARCGVSAGHTAPPTPPSSGPPASTVSRTSWPPVLRRLSSAGVRASWVSSMLPTNANPSGGLAGRASAPAGCPRRERGGSTWLILPVAYACLKD